MSIVFIGVVLFGKSLNVMKNFSIILIIALSISFAIGIASGVESILGNSNGLLTVDTVYYYFRLASISFNFIAYIASSTALYFHLNHGGKSTAVIMSTLISRFKYYPACQAITRAGG